MAVVAPVEPRGVRSRSRPAGRAGQPVAVAGWPQARRFYSDPADLLTIDVLVDVIYRAFRRRNARRGSRPELSSFPTSMRTPRLSSRVAAVSCTLNASTRYDTVGVWGGLREIERRRRRLASRLKPVAGDSAGRVGARTRYEDGSYSPPASTSRAPPTTSGPPVAEGVTRNRAGSVTQPPGPRYGLVDAGTRAAHGPRPVRLSASVTADRRWWHNGDGPVAARSRS